MIYKEYKKASIKHLKTCECILKILDSKQDCKADSKHLESNLFYLSGYIVESIFKYMIFVSLNYDREKNIKELDEDGITYKNTINIHSLQRLNQKLQTKHSLSTQFTNEELSKWDVSIRYEEKSKLNLEYIKSFFLKAKKLYYELYKN